MTTVSGLQKICAQESCSEIVYYSIFEPFELLSWSLRLQPSQFSALLTYTKLCRTLSIHQAVEISRLFRIKIMPAFDDSDFGVPVQPIMSSDLSRVNSNGSNSSYGASFGSHISIPSEPFRNSVEIPATRSTVADTSSYMHSLSLSPSMRDRKGSRRS